MGLRVRLTGPSFSCNLKDRCCRVRMASLRTLPPLPLAASPHAQLRGIIADRPLSRRAAITIIFSRAVIPIGSNYAELGDDDSINVNGINPLFWWCVWDTQLSTAPPVPGIHLRTSRMEGQPHSQLHFAPIYAT